MIDFIAQPGIAILFATLLFQGWLARIREEAAERRYAELLGQQRLLLFQLRGDLPRPPEHAAAPSDAAEDKPPMLHLGANSGAPVAS